ncbi:baseplate J/gp47 family protein [Kribbella sp. NPDC049174]|uniref:baseplate J/gp47 family protein n=1 Tax=Kribbella sp. NPDC049174 TaxID=3364112 RepID=UPI003715DF8D
MSFAAEPYGVFAADLIANLTGGTSRLRFHYIETELPFQIPEHERVLPETLRVTGLAGGLFTTFVSERDFAFRDGELQWQHLVPGEALPGATIPDLGTDVWVGFDRRTGGPPPVLTDRNPGSITRTLAESFALELAVISHQLDGVYSGSFVATAGGRDLDQLAALVGVERRGVTHAAGEVVLARSTPAPADVTVVAGTLISTSADAPIAVTVETTATVTLRRGTVSAQAPVRALAAGPTGVAAARTLTVLHRPIFGIEEVLNPEPMAFRGGAETDADLRARIQYSLARSGRGTRDALVGALMTVEGIREQDVLVEEDHLAFPGVVKVTIATKLTEAAAVLARAALDEARPAGVRVDDNLLVPAPAAPTLAENTGGGGDGPTSGVLLDGVFMPLEARLTVTPGDTGLTDEQRRRLEDDTAATLIAAVDALGVGEPVIYNRLVSAVMAVSGVLDAVIDIGPKDRPAGEPLKRYNVRPPVPGARAQLERGNLGVTLRGERVVVDLTVVVERRGLAASAEAEAALGAARADIERRLVEALALTPPVLTPAALLGMLDPTADYAVEELSYRVELIDEGVRVTASNVTVPLGPAQQVWVRSVIVTETQVVS